MRRAVVVGRAVGHNLHLAGLFVGLLHSAAGCREGESAGHQETPGTTAQGTENRQADVGGNYFGVYEIGGLRQGAWLHLDNDSLGGAIYGSPRELGRHLLHSAFLRVGSFEASSPLPPEVVASTPPRPA